MSIVFFPVFHVQGEEAIQHIDYIARNGRKQFVEYLHESGEKLKSDSDIAEHLVSPNPSLVEFDGKTYAVATNEYFPTVGVYLRHDTDEVTP